MIIAIPLEIGLVLKKCGGKAFQESHTLNMPNITYLHIIYYYT